MRMFYEQGERGIQDKTFTALPYMFETVDDFGNLFEIDYPHDVLQITAAWFFLQSQPLANCYADDVHQDGFGI